MTPAPRAWAQGGAETNPAYLPWVANNYRVLAARLGFGATTTPVTRYIDLDLLNAGWYVDWLVTAAPATPQNIEYVQTIRVHQTLACDARHHSDRVLCPYAEPLSYVAYPAAATITATAQTRPGALWLIGNEMDRKDWAYCLVWDGDFCEQIGYDGQDEILPETYAVAFHDLAALVRSADPTARIAIGGLIQATPVRLAYLTQVWDSYQAQYGEPMPVDVWNVHNFILQEQRNNWGADMPPGSTVDVGEYVGNPLTHIDLTIFDRQVRAFRQWMKERNQQDKPLIVSEFGVLYQNDAMGLPAEPRPIHEFLQGTFAYFLNAKDCNLGYPADECRLVQRWSWFSLDDQAGDFNPYSRLFDPDTLQLTSTGRQFQTFAQENFSSLSTRGYR
jgi:hypothetical protein